MENYENLQAEFNSSLNSLGRLNYLLSLCNDYSRESLNGGLNYEYLKEWKYTVLSIYRELYPKMNTKEIVQTNNLISYYRRFEPILMSIGEPMDSETIINRKGFIQRWKLTDKLEKHLRKLADTKGMLITNKGDMRWAMAD